MQRRFIALSDVNGDFCYLQSIPFDGTFPERIANQHGQVFTLAHRGSLGSLSIPTYKATGQVLAVACLN